jgi:hypothetical protein
MNRGIFSLMVALSLGVSAAGQSPDSAHVKGHWHCLLEPYVFFANLNGNIDAGTPPPSHVSQNAGDIFSHSHAGIMLFFEVSNDKWQFSSDLTYLNLDADADSAEPVLQGHADIKQLGWEVAALKMLNPRVSVGLGFQLNSIQSGVNLKLDTGRGPFLVSGDLTRTWVDPTLILAVNLPIGAAGKWDFRGRGNIGGFGIGSKVYWQLQGYVDYHVSKLFQASIGYRAIKVDYEKGSGSDYFLYNLITFGPVFRVGFNF